VTNHSEAHATRTVRRVSLTRCTTEPARGRLGRLFDRPLSYHLAERAPGVGIRYATVTRGRAGFVPAAKRIVGSRSTLDAFVEQNREDLANAVLLRLNGVAVSLRGVPG